MKCLANKQLPQQQIALKAQDMLTDLEMRVILRMACGTSNAAKHVLELDRHHGSKVGL